MQGDISILAREFNETGAAILPGFLDPAIMIFFLNWMDQAKFRVKNEMHEGKIFGTTLFAPETEPSLFLLHFLLNRPALFETVQGVTGCKALANFTGRIHRTSAESGHLIDWHDDAAQAREVGLSINLGREPFSGGALEIRDPDKRIKAEASFKAPGDAFLFRIDRGWQHRLSPVSSGKRTVGVGWFRTSPDWRTTAWTPSRVERQILALAINPYISG